MLSVMRKSWLLFAVFALVALSSALSLEEALHIDGIEDYLHFGKRQQASGTGSAQDPSPEPESTPAPEPPSSNPPPPQSTPPPASATPPPPAPSSKEPDNQPPPSASASPSPNEPDQPSQPEQSSTPNQPAPPSTPTSGGNDNGPSETPAPGPSNPPATTPGATPGPGPVSTERITAPVVRTTPLVATSYQEYVTVYTTISNGQNVIVSQRTSSAALITTGQAEYTQLPDPQSGPSNSGSGGISEGNKKIIGGVIGGIGGAILLGGIAIVCWRMWGRKKRVSEDDDDLMAGTGAALGDKSHSSPNSTPFQTNLEQYHNPGVRPNAAANF
ncbi:hypothetical protein BDV95DRAFT_628281 [Massariosphaeria phaeospora]|uniref:Mid2 domain-containing protein n=1 Tax=Massariosphaeria phaeospora TaxID=100035 RepID=A0A7C8I9K8_9PLEO|nr:hypothetical protein BDV95DRAFT_628281 [Massariosphaeria phaeospora]